MDEGRFINLRKNYMAEKAPQGQIEKILRDIEKLLNQAKGLAVSRKNEAGAYLGKVQQTVERTR